MNFALEQSNSPLAVSRLILTIAVSRSNWEGGNWQLILAAANARRPHAVMILKRLAIQQPRLRDGKPVRYPIIPAPAFKNGATTAGFPSSSQPEDTVRAGEQAHGTDTGSVSAAAWETAEPSTATTSSSSSSAASPPVLTCTTITLPAESAVAAAVVSLQREVERQAARHGAFASGVVRIEVGGRSGCACCSIPCA